LCPWTPPNKRDERTRVHRSDVTRGLATSGTAKRGLETVPTNESHLLALGVWTSFGGNVQARRRADPPSEHRGRRLAFSPRQLTASMTPFDDGPSFLTVFFRHGATDQCALRQLMVGVLADSAAS